MSPLYNHHWLIVGNTLPIADLKHFISSFQFSEANAQCSMQMHNPKRLNLSTRKRTLPYVSLWTKLCSSDMSSLTISQLYNSLFSNGNEDTVHLKEQICYFKICIQRERGNHPYVFNVQEFPKVHAIRAG